MEWFTNFKNEVNERKKSNVNLDYLTFNLKYNNKDYNSIVLEFGYLFELLPKKEKLKILKSAKKIISKIEKIYESELKNEI